MIAGTRTGPHRARLWRRVQHGLVAALLVIGTAWLSGQHPSDAASIQPVANPLHVASYQYAGTANPEQSLTATYSPLRTNAPWIVVIHGGSWLNGSQANMAKSVRLFSSRGWQVFNLSYRLAGATYAQQVSDVQTAAHWIVAHAVAFHLGPDRGAVYGFSAGGQLATVLGLTGPFRAIVSASGVLQPQRVALYADAPHTPAAPAPSAMIALYTREQQMMGCAFAATMTASCATAWYAFEPEHLINPNSPAMLIFQGADDPCVPPSTAAAFGYWLGVSRVPHTVVVVPGYGHDETEVFGSSAREQQMLAFVAAHTR